MNEAKTLRRYYLLKAQYWNATPDREIFANGYWAKQDALPGTALPADTPALAELTAAHYTKREDLDGADVNELVRQGLRRKDAEGVLRLLGFGV